MECFDPTAVKFTWFTLLLPKMTFQPSLQWGIASEQSSTMGIPGETSRGKRENCRRIKPPLVVFCFK